VRRLGNHFANGSIRSNFRVTIARTAFSFFGRAQRSERSLKGVATILTDPPLQRLEGRKASVADGYAAGTGQQILAQAAAGGEQNADDSVASLGQPTGPRFHAIMWLHHAN